MRSTELSIGVLTLFLFTLLLLYIFQRSLIQEDDTNNDNKAPRIRKRDRLQQVIWNFNNWIRRKALKTNDGVVLVSSR